MSGNDGLTKPEISSIGIHEVFIELLWHGFKPQLPQKADHMRGAVLFATNPVTGKAIKLFVKVTIVDCKRSQLLHGKVLGWPMGEHHKTLREPDVFYCFVFIDLQTHQAQFFIMSSVFVFDNLKAQYDQWLKVAQRSSTGYENFPAKFCVGVDSTAKYSLPIPLEADYQDRWDLLTY